MTRARARCSPANRLALCSYIKQAIELSSPAQLNALMKFLQPEESSGRAGSVGASSSKPVSPIADDKAEEASLVWFLLLLAFSVHSFTLRFCQQRCLLTLFILQVAEQQYKRIVAEAESKFINVLISDRAPQHRSLESSSKSQQYSKRLHRCAIALFDCD
jgi:hypothetical protein